MLSLLRLPDFPKPFVTRFAFPNLAHLRVKVFQLLSLRVRRHSDGPFFRNEGNVVVSILVRCPVEDGLNSFAYSHVVSAPTGIEQDTIAIFRRAIRERDE